jgi:hypothetical protein
MEVSLETTLENTLNHQEIDSKFYKFNPKPGIPLLCLFHGCYSEMVLIGSNKLLHEELNCGKNHNIGGNYCPVEQNFSPTYTPVKNR